MACAGCGQARGMVVAGIRGGSGGMVARGVAMGVAVNWQKMRGTYSDANYGGPTGQTPLRRATPYQRPADRTK